MYRVPAVDEHGRVVKPVEKNEVLLSSYYEECIEEFGELGSAEKCNPCSGYAFFLT
jgi:hypothetical protein